MYKFCIVIMMSCFINQSCTKNTKDENIASQKSVSQNLAKVTAVECVGQPFNYSFDVTIESPDLGCVQYADWWEVLTPDSMLIYRRILTHSHVDEQPFTRSGGIVNTGADDLIIVRAHMNNLGYGMQVFSGTPREGLIIDSLDQSFGLSLESIDPLPNGCAF